jgi:hypothetical protein
MFASGFEGGAGERSGTGSAVYLVASLVNHSCVPNLDVVFPRNDSTLVSNTVACLAMLLLLLLSRYCTPWSLNIPTGRERKWRLALISASFLSMPT